jgi:ComF family protein
MCSYFDIVYLYMIVPQTVKAFTHSLIHLFYPRLCEGCNKPLLAAEQVLCISCALELPETGFAQIEGNEAELRFAGRVPFAHATSLAYFTGDGLLQHLLHGLKYKNHKETGTYLGRRLGKALLKTQWASSVDLIIPVPLHKAKKASRGYNQSMLIAEGISEILKIPAGDDRLLRVRQTVSQTNKSRADRVKNMEEAFRVKNKGSLTGKHILLCDDVLTTGATLEACALALLDEENIKISFATIGIAVS